MKTRHYILLLCAFTFGFMIGAASSARTETMRRQALQAEIIRLNNDNNDLADALIDSSKQLDQAKRALAHEKYRHIS